MSDWESYQEDQWGQGDPDGPPVGTYFPPEFRLPYAGVPVGSIHAPLPPPPIVPSLYVVPTPTGAGNGDSATPGDSEVPVTSTAEVIDPGLDVLGTVGETEEGPVFEPGNEWYERTAPTDWGRVYDQWVVLNQPKPEENVAIDWGGYFEDFTTIGQIGSSFGWWGGNNQVGSLGPTGASAPSTVPQQPGVTMAASGACGPTGPKYGKICLATGVVTPLRRRRRRRLLTSSDIKDLSALKSIVGGAALQGAVVQAVRR